MRSYGIFGSVILGSLSIGCGFGFDGGAAETTGASGEQLSTADARVLGFEDPVSDWSSPQTTLNASFTVSEGSRALAVHPEGWTEIDSVPLSSLGEVHDVLSLDILVPTTLSWGDVRVVFESPSLSLWWHELPAVPLTGVPAGSFHTLQFPLSDALQASLARTYGDLTIKIILNGPRLTSPYLFDRLSIAAASPEPSEPGGTSLYGSLNQSLPNWALPRINAATALRELRVNDDVSVQTATTEPANVACLGAVSNLGVESEVGDITGVGDVVLRDRAQVFGDATAGGFISYFPGSTVHGTATAWTTVESGSVDFKLDLGARGPDFTTPATSVLAPGRYGRVAVQSSGSTMTFSAGVYALNDLYVASGSELLIDSSRGPVIVLVSDSATVHGLVRDADGGFPEWILAYSGTQEVIVGLRLQGAYFAPSAKLNVATTQIGHEGVAFAKDVELHQRARFVHHYYAPVWQKLCEAVGGVGGFCPQVYSAGPRCAVGLQPWAVGRNGNSPGFPLEFEWPTWSDACRIMDGLAWVGFKEDEDYQSPRAMVGLDTEVRGVFGSNWAAEVRAEEVGFGDLDGDGRDEFVIGRGPAGNARLVVHDDMESGFEPIQELFDGWSGEAGVRALAFADFDSDGRDEVAVARNAPDGGPEVFVFDGVMDELTCGPRVTLQEIDQYGAGDRMVRALAFGDVDNDGFIELVMGRDGHPTTQADRIVVKQVAEDGSVVGFGRWSKEAQDATAIAVGDFENDGILEIAAGRSAADGPRVSIYRFNSALSRYETVRELHDGWDDGRGTTALAFGDLDEDGDDELVVGRDGCPSCEGPSARVIIHDYQGTPDEYPVIQEIGEVEDWGKERGATSLAIGDVNGDGSNDLMIGRSVGGGARVLFFDGPPGALQEFHTWAEGWADNRGAQNVAIAPRPVCQARPVIDVPDEGGEPGEDPLPDSVEASKSQFSDRLAEVIEATLDSFLPSLACLDLSDPELSVKIFGEWGEGNSTEPLRRMMAGLAAIQLGGTNARLADDAARLMGLGFPNLVNQYILEHVHQFKPVGTDYDFDFEQMAIAGLVYRFRTTPHPTDPSTFLLGDAAVAKLLSLDCEFERSKNPDCVSCCPDRTQPQLLQAQLNASLNPGSLCISEKLFPTFELSFSLHTPETENHVLMINTWNYLVHQWNVTDDPRAPGSGLPVAAPTALEDKLLQIVGRVVKNGMWETNARAYAAFSVRPLQLLASYAGSARLRTGARNALDFLATQFAFHSFHGKRLTPMRRNWKYKDRLGVYDNDYLPAVFGVLTGDKLFDTSPDCVSHCQYEKSQVRGFALESALTSYRIPDVIVDHMLNPDGGRDGFGSWARMQSRYTENHYRMFNDPVYHELGAPGDSVEPAHEFYFRTGDYLNSAGGRREHYAAFKDAIADATDYAFWGPLSIVEPGVMPFVDVVSENLGLWLDYWEKLAYGTDFLSRPTVLLGNLDNGYWSDSGAAASQTLWMKGSDSIWDSNNTGVYKNFALGYGGLAIPKYLGENPSAMVGPWLVTAVDASKTSRLFSKANYHLVIGQQGSLGFWEVVPKDLFGSAQALLDQVVASNTTGLSTTPAVYTTVVSGEALTLNPEYPAAPPFSIFVPPFLAIDGASPANLHHVGSSQTANFPLIEVRQVDARYRFTGVRYACASGDGRLVVFSPTLSRRLVIDSRDSLNPTRVDDGGAVDPCPGILGLP